MDIVVPVVVTFLLFIFFVGIAFITALAKNGDRLILHRILESPQRTTITPSDVEALPEVILTSEETCIICLETMTSGESAIKLTCGHVFHGDCIAGWWQREFRLRPSHTTCPVCRREEPQMTATPAKPGNEDEVGIVSTSV
mmetsp:Transcript_40753/g.64125  ORF Transcript_40753/g.64125 Transcript_40753/m.64125 type:complete len:141 (-) Transcript_40753:67-489(-)